MVTLMFSVTNAPSQDSIKTIPANAYIWQVSFEPTIAYSAGATVKIGRATSLDLLMTTAQNTPQNLNMIYVKNFWALAWGGTTLVVRTTISGTPALGAGTVTIKYSLV